jgi:hypothetical protein
MIRVIESASATKESVMIASETLHVQADAPARSIKLQTPARAGLGIHRSVRTPIDSAPLRERNTGDNQATQRDLGLYNAGGDHQRDGNTECRIAGQEQAVASRNFSTIPIFAADRLNPPRASPWFASAALTAGVRPALAIGPIDDHIEREADRMASQVMNGPESRPSVTHVPPQLKLKCAGCAAQPGRSCNAADISPNEETGKHVPAIVGEVLRSTGNSLDPDTRAFMEPRFGQDLSQVRVHIDAKAAESARTINAAAYTIGQHVVFGAGRYEPAVNAGRELLAHELAHTLQQRQASDAQLVIDNEADHEREASVVADNALHQTTPIPSVKALDSRLILRQKLGPDESGPRIERSIELMPHLIPMDAPAVREVEKCEEFPGGSTDCEVNEQTGIPTGRVTHRTDETNPCTRPCVEQHEAVHLPQLKTLCQQLRDCYLAADKGKRPASDCFKMTFSGTKERECAAYRKSVPCMERRLKTAKDCQSTENKEYGTRKLASEKCFRDKNCGGSADLTKKR